MISTRLKKLISKIIILNILLLIFLNINSFAVTLDYLEEVSRLKATEKIYTKKQIEKESKYKFDFYTDKEIDKLIPEFDENKYVWVNPCSRYEFYDNLSTVSIAKYKGDLIENYKRKRDYILKNKNTEIYTLEHCYYCHKENLLGFLGEIDTNPDEMELNRKGNGTKNHQYCVKCFNKILNQQLKDYLDEYLIEKVKLGNVTNGRNKMYNIIDMYHYALYDWKDIELKAIDNYSVELSKIKKCADCGKYSGLGIELIGKTFYNPWDFERIKDGLIWYLCSECYKKEVEDNYDEYMSLSDEEILELYEGKIEHDEKSGED